MGIRRSRLPFVTLLAGLAGLCFALLFQYYTAVFDWPLDVGGKPENSTLAFVPICFELTVLFGGLATVAAFLLRARLFPGKREQLPVLGVTNDVFARRDARAAGRKRIRARPPHHARARRRRGRGAGRANGRGGRIVTAPRWILVAPGGGRDRRLRRRRQRPGARVHARHGARPGLQGVRPQPATRNGLTLQAPVAGTIARGHRLHRSTTAPARRRRRAPGAS